MSTATTTNRKRALLGEHVEETPKRSKLLSYTLLENELQSLRSELEHERSLRELDQRRAAQTKSRLERQVQFASEEAEDAKQLLEANRIESEGHIQNLREGRQEALEELRDCQAQLVDVEELLPDVDDATAQDKIAQLEAQLEARTEQVESLRKSLEEVIAEGEQQRLLLVAQKKQPNEDNESISGSLAPKAVLQELNKVRIALAESDRKYRQLRRKSDDWNKKAQQFVQLKEISTGAKLRISKLEMDIKEMQRELENRRATNERWEEFAKELGQVLKLTSSGPPEVATVMRHLQKQLHQVKTMESDKTNLERDMQKSSEKIAVLEKQVRDTATAATRLQRDFVSTEKELDQAKLQIQILRAQEQIWQREADGLRSLLKTFDDVLPGSPDGAAATKSLELSLATAREETTVIKQERDRLLKEMETTTTDKQRLQKELDRVSDKFIKIRDALMVERAKAEKAEDRALQAETLAGKGQLNPDVTRALHLEKNPLSDAIRERYHSEINSLKKKIEETTGENPVGVASTPAAKSDVDPEKLHQRLKDTFKEQIGIFREGVYLITGYKIDMLLDKSTPYFKVKSVYGEREEDVLVFNWPKGVKQPKSLDLRATDFAKVLATTDGYQYLTKYDSMPGFMASTQLSLLEKCTFIGAPTTDK
jgi:hypothetical protein